MAGQARWAWASHGDEVEVEHGLDRIDDRVDRVVATQPKLLLRQPAERAPRHAALRALAAPCARNVTPSDAADRGRQSEPQKQVAKTAGPENRGSARSDALSLSVSLTWTPPRSGSSRSAGRYAPNAPGTPCTHNHARGSGVAPNSPARRQEPASWHEPGGSPVQDLHDLEGGELTAAIARRPPEVA